MAVYAPTYPSTPEARLPDAGSSAAGPALRTIHRFAKPLRIFASGFFHARSQGGLPWVNAMQPSA